MLNCLVIDDEELARKLLASYIAKVDSLNLVETLENPLDALDYIKKETVDLIFLDIQMPEVKGTDFARLLPKYTQVIFTTAYSEYALEGYELNAVDYLLKPITFKRFLQAVQKATPSNKQAVGQAITIKSGYDLFRVPLNEIDFIESDSEYVIYHTAQGKIMSNQSLKSLMEVLPPQLFLRIHRSYIVNRSRIRALKNRNVILGEISLPVSDSYYAAVRDLF